MKWPQLHPDAGLPGRTGDFLELMRVDKPIGTLLLLWPTLTALWLAAGGTPSPGLILIFTLGVIVMRAANNNRYAADYSRWFRETFGVPSESDAIAQMGLSNALIGPMPAREADRVPYRAIGAGPVLLTPKDYRIVAPLADYAKAHDAIITEAARKAAGGDLGAIARATKS